MKSSWFKGFCKYCWEQKKFAIRHFNSSNLNPSSLVLIKLQKSLTSIDSFKKNVSLWLRPRWYNVRGDQRCLQRSLKWVFRIFCLAFSGWALIFLVFTLFKPTFLVVRKKQISLVPIVTRKNTMRQTVPSPKETPQKTSNNLDDPHIDGLT